MIVILVSFNEKKREKSHVRYPAKYPAIRHTDKTAEYQQTAGVPLAPQIGFPMISGNPFSYLHPHPNSSTR